MHIALVYFKPALKHNYKMPNVMYYFYFNR